MPSGRGTAIGARCRGSCGCHSSRCGMRQSDRRSVTAIREENEKARLHDARDAQGEDCESQDQRKADQLHGLALPRAGVAGGLAGHGGQYRGTTHTNARRDRANNKGPGFPGPLTLGRNVAYFSELLIEVNLAFRLVPRPFTTAMIASEMPAAMRPYSMAVAPD